MVYIRAPPSTLVGTGEQLLCKVHSLQRQEAALVCFLHSPHLHRLRWDVTFGQHSPKDTYLAAARSWHGKHMARHCNPASLWEYVGWGKPNHLIFLGIKGFKPSLTVSLNSAAAGLRRLPPLSNSGNFSADLPLGSRIIEFCKAKVGRGCGISKG